MASSGSDVKECWYSVLGVERNATAEEIRLKYRKEALKWHPDKIQQSGATAQECQEATARFQNIVQAYEVLSDPVERAWYDKYRSEILSSGTASKDFEFNVFSFFSPSAFSGFGDTGKGFYKVYKDVFANIHKKEQAFAKAYGIGPIGEAPSIGIPTSPISDVEEFYRYWTGFSTVKDFSWCDEYQVSQAPNRKVRRLMEEENSKIRKRERRAYNDAVRDLATFVKKRDKRWLERQLELQRLQKEKDLQMKLRKQKLQEEKIAKARAVKEQDWMKVESTALDEGDGIVDANEGSYGWKGGVRKKSEDEDLQEFFCIICNKRFRSEKQWKNHEKSKKHVERASALRQSLLDEDEEADSLGKDLNLKTDELESPRLSRGKASGTPEGATGEAGGESALNAGSERFGHLSKQRAAPERIFPKDPQRDKHTRGNGSEEDEDEGVDEAVDDENSLLVAMMNSRISRLAVPATKAQGSHDANTGDVADEQDREPTADDLSSDSDEEAADVVNRSDDNEDSLPDSTRKSNRFSSVETTSAETSRKKVSFAVGAGSTHAGEEDEDEEEDDDEEEQEEREEREEKDRDEEDEEVGSSGDFGKRSGRRRSKAERNREAAKGRYESLYKELSTSTSENGRGLENGVDSDDELQGLSIGVPQKSQPPLKPKNKKQQRGQKKSKFEAALSHQSELAGKKGSMKGKGGSKPASNTCDTCGEDFDSRSQLFRHLSSTNHATLKSR